MKYPKHFQEYRAPEINLPYGGKITRVLLTYFTIDDENDKSDPRKRGSCKTCGKVIHIIVGSRILNGPNIMNYIKWS